MAGELPRPGVQVVQVFRTVTPTVITPSLMPNVVGVAKQVVPLSVSDGAGGSLLNADALVQLPAFFVAKAASGSPTPVYGGLDGLVLAVQFNNGTEVSVTFSDTLGGGLTPSTVVSQIQAAFLAAGVTAGLAELVGDGTTQWQLRTVGVGDFQSIYITATTSPAVLAAFGIGIGHTYAGLGAYNQYDVLIPQAAFPDPRGNLDELGIEQDSIRVFFALGSGTDIREAMRDSAFLRNGTVDDPAVVTGSVDLATLTLPGDLDTLTVVLSVGGGANQTVTFATPANPAAVLSQIDAQTTGLVASQTGGGLLVLTSDDVGSDASIEIVSGTALSVLGLTVGVYAGVSIAVIDDGDGNSLSPILKFVGEDFTATPTAAVVTATDPATNPADGATLIISDGQQVQTIVFAGVAAFADILSQINAVVGTAAGGRITASDAGSSTLRLTHSDTGTDSVIQILGGTALANLDPNVSPTLIAGFYRGVPNKPVAGDEVWIDGVYVGNVSAVAPGGVVTNLKLDKQLALDLGYGRDFFIIAKNLPTTGRPDPDLVITAAGAALLKAEQLRDTRGARVDVSAPMYVSYTAVRRDVTAIAKNPGLLIFDNTTELEEALSPIDSSNPLALGLFFALVNGPGIQVTGLGVDEVSSDAPYGTADAFTRAAGYLEGQEVYATTPLTHDATVHQVWKAHAEAMSEPEARGERVAIVNLEFPTTKLDTLVASGAAGDSVSTTVFNTQIANMAALLLNAGISPVGTIPVSAGLYLDIGSDAKRYSISALSGANVTIRTSFASGENDDGYYSTTAFTGTLIQEPFSVKVRGAALLSPTGVPDNNGVASTVAATGLAYGSRRLWMTVPDQCAATINGLETLLPGFYMCAGIAGLIGAQPPQQSFTNFPMAGFTRVIGSNTRFSERQMNIMAGGGAYIIVQDAPSAPLVSRHALTTNLTSIETRTDSITKVVDFTAKVLRRAVKSYVGRFNITQGFLDSVGTVVDGVGGFLIEAGVLTGFSPNNIIQDEDAPDSVLIDVTLAVPYPCNYLRLTLVI